MWLPRDVGPGINMGIHVLRLLHGHPWGKITRNKCNWLYTMADPMFKWFKPSVDRVNLMFHWSTKKFTYVQMFSMLKNPLDALKLLLYHTNFVVLSSTKNNIIAWWKFYISFYYFPIAILSYAILMSCLYCIRLILTPWKHTIIWICINFS